MTSSDREDYVADLVLYVKPEIDYVAIAHGENGGWRRRHRRTDAEQGDVFSAGYKERCVRYGLESVETMEVDKDDVPACDGGLAQLGVESGAGKKRDHCPGCRRSLLVEKST